MWGIHDKTMVLIGTGMKVLCFVIFFLKEIIQGDITKLPLWWFHNLSPHPAEVLQSMEIPFYSTKEDLWPTGVYELEEK